MLLELILDKLWLHNHKAFCLSYNGYSEKQLNDRLIRGAPYKLVLHHILQGMAFVHSFHIFLNSMMLQSSIPRNITVCFLGFKPARYWFGDINSCATLVCRKA
ncbi:uncharacterized protein ASCRUDRAFT_78911 [Ascoidea rubescens DSM 1968]|uniref:Uncharacterized protein n=1 Tax=Ascoidea rubescens DSM 1968 TaxID=1344418 RepID=A0A1D2VQR4_9ASCO|nr:hypothetical protein ASCRUDRAFT_78911 [Ascoidea rubescens DSM 1968]ODV63940.1 hypothetical protein ASCRUDRAFT_78911 [Ascoidea rubescens DSM 1968]